MPNLLRRRISPAAARVALVAYGALMLVMHRFYAQPVVYVVALAAFACLYIVGLFIIQRSGRE